VLAIHKSIGKRKVSNIPVDNSKMSIVLEIRLTLIHRVVDSCRWKL